MSLEALQSIGVDKYMGCIYKQPKMFTNGKVGVSPEQIIIAVCDYFKITEERLKERLRKRELVLARQIAMYMMCKFCYKISLKSIGNHFGFDHTTVVHSRDTLQDLLDTDKELTIIYQIIKSKIQ